jgi:hypothetical protein
LEIVKLCCGLRQEILDPETALALDQDNAGTLSKTGSIGGVTPMPMVACALGGLSFSAQPFGAALVGSK